MRSLLVLILNEVQGRRDNLAWDCDVVGGFGMDGVGSFLENVVLD